MQARRLHLHLPRRSNAQHRQTRTAILSVLPLHSHYLGLARTTVPLSQMATASRGPPQQVRRDLGLGPNQQPATPVILGLRTVRRLVERNALLGQVTSLPPAPQPAAATHIPAVPVQEMRILRPLPLLPHLSEAGPVIYHRQSEGRHLLTFQGMEDLRRSKVLIRRIRSSFRPAPRYRCV